MHNIIVRSSFAPALRAFAALALLLATTPTFAVPLGTATMAGEVAAVGDDFFTCLQLTFNDATYDVGGTPINLSTQAGGMFCTGSIVGGVATSHCESTTAGAFAFDPAIVFICDPPDCFGNVSFVSSAINNVTGTIPLSLPGATYSFDGAASFQGFGESSIPGCTLTSVAKFLGVTGLNAFPVLVTDPDTTTVSTDTTFFNPITNEQETVAVQVSFGDVTGTGSTTITASSNASAVLTSNFAASIGGFQAAFIDVVTTAPYVPPIEICTTYPDSAPDDGIIDGTSVPEEALSLTHDEGGTFVDRTSSRDFVNNVICASVNSLSYFGLVVRNAGICSSPGAVCDDGDVCTATDLCDGDGNCVGSGSPDCSDGLSCTLDACVSPSGCVHSPRPSCIAATKSQLAIVRNGDDDSKEKLGFKWSGGPGLLQSQLGDASSTDTEYSLCVFDSTGLVLAAQVEGGNTCGDKPCWSIKETSAKFKDKAGAQDGVNQIQLKAGDVDKTKLALKGKGTNLDFAFDARTLAPPVTAQLGAEGGLCFEGTYASEDEVKKNDGVKFSGKEKP